MYKIKAKKKIMLETFTNKKKDFHDDDGILKFIYLNINNAIKDACKKKINDVYFREHEDKINKDYWKVEQIHLKRPRHTQILESEIKKVEVKQFHYHIFCEVEVTVVIYSDTNAIPYESKFPIKFPQYQGIAIYEEWKPVEGGIIDFPDLYEFEIEEIKNDIKPIKFVLEFDDQFKAGEFAMQYKDLIDWEQYSKDNLEPAEGWKDEQ